ncbi:hypothetical protein KGF57_004225 [Candida theae]|uniref:DUF1742-domain-containing protein n=1 Tax=Candida theae TaxID=1198502 RepID=A0AAD5BBM5_9ASCO|nr:uncharacterized protein KGF57_004225 [Candida theae]KAI5952096.1 hypothetical protein KGF57_004225 [Candida theae]
MSTPPQPTAKQQLQPPFPNKYNARLVAQQDSKPCTICFKPSTTVLLADNNADFFYTCAQHLRDDQFASPIPSDEYTALQKQVDELRSQVDKLRVEVEAAKPYLWGISSYWSTSKERTSTADNKSDESSDKYSNKEKEKKQSDSTTAKQDSTTYESLKAKLLKTEQELAEKQTELTQYKFKKYTLNQQVYRNRLMLNQKKIYNKQRTEKIQQPGFFPSAPHHNIA